MDAWFAYDRTIFVYDDNGGSVCEEIPAQYTIADDGAADYLLDEPQQVSDPLGLNREFLGWAYYNNNVESILLFNQVFPDTGKTGCAIIPKNVNRIYVKWENPQSLDYEIDLPAEVQYVPEDFEPMDEENTGTASFYPALTYRLNQAQFDHIREALQNEETVNRIVINQVNNETYPVEFTGDEIYYDMDNDALFLNNQDVGVSCSLEPFDQGYGTIYKISDDSETINKMTDPADSDLIVVLNADNLALQTLYRGFIEDEPSHSITLLQQGNQKFVHFVDYEVEYDSAEEIGTLRFFEDSEHYILFEFHSSYDEETQMTNYYSDVVDVKGFDNLTG